MGKIALWSNSTELRDTVTIIQLINEPTLWDDYDVRLGRLKDYYGLAYHEIRKYNPDVVVAVSDAFIDADNWYYFDDLPEYHSVMLDIHMYQVTHKISFQLNSTILICDIRRYSGTNGVR